MEVLHEQQKSLSLTRPEHEPYKGDKSSEWVSTAAIKATLLDGHHANGLALSMMEVNLHELMQSIGCGVAIENEPFHRLHFSKP